MGLAGEEVVIQSFIVGHQRKEMSNCPAPEDNAGNKIEHMTSSHAKSFT